MLYNVACVDVGATQGQSKYIQQLKRDMYNNSIVQKIKSTREYCEREFALDWLMEYSFYLHDETTSSCY